MLTIEWCHHCFSSIIDVFLYMYRRNFYLLPFKWTFFSGNIFSTFPDFVKLQDTLVICILQLLTFTIDMVYHFLFGKTCFISLMSYISWENLIVICGKQNSMLFICVLCEQGKINLKMFLTSCLPLITVYSDTLDCHLTFLSSPTDRVE
jgi:hypothetical protein